MRSLYGSPLGDIFDFAPRRRNREVHSVGSGSIVHERGYIVTNAHVVSQASDIQITFANGRTVSARIVAVDPPDDLAILKVESPGKLPTLELGRSDDLMIGETVVAIGNPLSLQHTVTSGIISALDREALFANDVAYTGLIQTDAPINFGNSGGPLLNINGKLIGINTAIRGDAQNIGFAIPVDKIWQLVPAMLDIERHDRVRFGLDVEGPQAEVVRVRPDSPAARAGVRSRDRVVQVNGRDVHDAIDYHVQLRSLKPDSKVRLKLARGERTLDVSVPLESIPVPDGRARAEQLFGLRLREIPQNLRAKYDLPDYVGLIVEEVVPDSPAEYAGLRASDIILRLHRVSVVTLDDVGLTLEQTRPGERVLVEGLRIGADRPFLWTATLRARRSR
jgi:serine protease Do